MPNPDDLIRRQDAINAIRSAMKRIYTAARRQGYKECVDILERIPSARETEISVAEPVFLSPAQLHSFWFLASDWWLCDNCGGRCSESRQTPHCPHCGARMDAMKEIE